MAIQVEHAVGEIALASGPDLEVVVVDLGHSQHIGDVDVIDKISQCLQPPQETGDLIHGDVLGDPAGDDGCIVGHLAPEDGQHLVGQTTHI